MMNTLKKHFVYQADYQHWANDMLFNAVDSLDEGARQSDQGISFDSIHKTVNHILIVTRNWMARLKQESVTTTAEEHFIADWKDLKNALRHEYRAMQRWLEAQPESFFDDQIEYRENHHTSRMIWVRDALTQIMTHAAHQRGQVAAIAVRLGAPEPEMGFLAYKQDMEKSLENMRSSQE